MVVPVLNEEESIVPYLASVGKILSFLPYQVEYVFVNDGSRDRTLEVLHECSKTFPIRIVNLSRNFGKEAALTAGIEHARGEAVIPMDVDLQDPAEILVDMLGAWEGGADVVLARRVDRSKDGWLKRKTAEWFYKVHNCLSDTVIPENVGDFRVIGRRVVDALLTMEERRRFMKGMFAWVGFRTATIDYVRAERTHGNTKFSGWKLWNLGLEGLTSFSTAPLRVWTYLGAFVSFYAFLHAAYIIVRTLIFGKDLAGYASLMTVMLFLGGVQLIGIGVLGEYIGRIYIESKKRPLYIVEGVYEAERQSTC